MTDKQSHYKVYVIRCWQEQDVQDDAITYRLTLEIPSTGQRLGFISSEALMSALERKLSQNSPEKSH